jgi:tRNA G10  N-methylase Trm11
MEMLNNRQDYVFITGKNWKLSLAELTSFSQIKQLALRVTDLSKSFFAVTAKEAIDPSIIDGFGGIIKIGKVISRIPLGTLEEAFLHRNKQAQTDIENSLSADWTVDQIFKTSSGKYVFGISVYFDNPRFLRFSMHMQRFLGNYFKEQLEDHGRKARFMGFPKDRELPQLTHVEVLKKGLIEKSAEIVLCIGREQAFVASTIAVHNPFEFQKRDVARPVQRKIFSIPPRLARIMVNLSLCSRDKVLLDPFCGVGTILQEAMLAGAQVTGMDIDPWCVKASRTNLEWLQREYNLKDAEYTVLVGDSCNLTKQIDKESVDCIATEPDLGPALRHFPTTSHAENIINKLKPLYWKFTEEAYKVLKKDGNLVLVTPCIKTRNGNFTTLEIGDKAKSAGFKTIFPFRREDFVSDSPLTAGLTENSSFVDIAKKHKIGREIHVFQK